MEYQVEELSPVKRRVSVEVPVEEVNAAIIAGVAMYRQGADLPGFRKGKIPPSVIESRYKKQIYAEATTDLVNLHINEIMGELNTSLVSPIDFDGKELVRDQPFRYAIGFEIMPEFDLPDYEGLEVEQEEPEVEEAAVEELFERVRRDMAEQKVITELREPCDDEIAVISFKAWIDGAPYKELWAENFNLTLGKGQALPDFEAIVKSLKKGEEKEGDVSFPPDFINPDLAGKTATFQVLLSQIKQQILPPVDDELAQKAGGFASLQEMRDAVRNSYLETRRQLARSRAQKRLLNALVSKVDFPLPESMVERHKARLHQDMADLFERQGKSITSIGKTEEEIDADLLAEAQSLTRAEIILLTVAAKEALTVTEQEIDYYFKQMAIRTKANFADLKNYHMQNNLMHALKDRLLADKAMELIYGKAKVNEVPAAVVSGTEAGSESSPA